MSVWFITRFKWFLLQQIWPCLPPACAIPQRHSPFFSLFGRVRLVDQISPLLRFGVPRKSTSLDQYCVRVIIETSDENKICITDQGESRISEKCLRRYFLLLEVYICMAVASLESLNLNSQEPPKTLLAHGTSPCCHTSYSLQFSYLPWCSKQPQRNTANAKIPSMAIHSVV